MVLIVIIFQPVRHDFRNSFATNYSDNLQMHSIKSNEQSSSKAKRGGDTSRSSSRGRKLSPGGSFDKKRKKKINDGGKTRIVAPER